MRISTSQIFEQNLLAMLSQQSKVAQAQNQMSSGKRIMTPADDPAGAVKILNYERAMNLAEQYQANANMAINRLGQEEIALESATDILQRIRELAVAGLNDSQSAEARQATASEIKQLNQQLFSLASTRDESGDYIFSGFANGTPPYPSLLGAYHGDTGQRYLKVGEGVLVETNDPANHIFEAPVIQTTLTSSAGNAGTASFSVQDNTNTPNTFAEFSFSYDAATQQMSVSNGDGTITGSFMYQAGQVVGLSDIDSALPGVKIQFEGIPADGDSFSIEKTTVQTSQTLFKTIDDFANALINNRVGPNDSPNNGDFLTNISASTNRIIDAQALIGGRVNAIQTQLEINDTLAFNFEKSLSEIQDLDFAEAISRLTRHSLSLQAAQQSFAQVQRLSLFNYL